MALECRLRIALPAHRREVIAGQAHLFADISGVAAGVLLAPLGDVQLNHHRVRSPKLQGRSSRPRIALLALLLLTGIGSPTRRSAAGWRLPGFVGALTWPLTLAIGLTGVVGSDMLLYSAGLHLAWRPRRSLEERVLSPARLRRVTQWFARFGALAVFGARLVPGTPALVFVTAGLQGLPASRFLIDDGLGALIWVPLILLVGHRLGDRVGDLKAVLGWTQHGGPWLAAFAAILLIVWLVWGREESKL
jgi:membrane protein DedA with SNARE-associated domain